MLASICCKVLLLFAITTYLIIKTLDMFLTYVKQTRTDFLKNKKNIFVYSLVCKCQYLLNLYPHKINIK